MGQPRPRNRFLGHYCHSNLYASEIGNMENLHTAETMLHESSVRNSDKKCN